MQHQLVADHEESKGAVVQEVHSLVEGQHAIGSCYKSKVNNFITGARPLFAVVLQYHQCYTTCGPLSKHLHNTCPMPPCPLQSTNCPLHMLPLKPIALHFSSSQGWTNTAVKPVLCCTLVGWAHILGQDSMLMWGGAWLRAVLRGGLNLKPCRILQGY